MAINMSRWRPGLFHEGSNPIQIIDFSSKIETGAPKGGGHHIGSFGARQHAVALEINGGD
jgi:hypothetical protein